MAGTLEFWHEFALPYAPLVHTADERTCPPAWLEKLVSVSPFVQLVAWQAVCRPAETDATLAELPTPLPRAIAAAATANCCWDVFWEVIAQQWAAIGWCPDQMCDAVQRLTTAWPRCVGVGRLQTLSVAMHCLPTDNALVRSLITLSDELASWAAMTAATLRVRTVFEEAVRNMSPQCWEARLLWFARTPESCPPLAWLEAHAARCSMDVWCAFAGCDRSNALRWALAHISFDALDLVRLLKSAAIGGAALCTAMLLAAGAMSSRYILERAIASSSTPTVQALLTTRPEGAQPLAVRSGHIADAARIANPELVGILLDVWTAQGRSVDELRGARGGDAVWRQALRHQPRMASKLVSVLLAARLPLTPPTMLTAATCIQGAPFDRMVRRATRVRPPPITAAVLLAAVQADRAKNVQSLMRALPHSSPMVEQAAVTAMQWDAHHVLLMLVRERCPAVDLNAVRRWAHEHCHVTLAEACDL